MSDVLLVTGFIILLLVLAVLAFRQLRQEGHLQSFDELNQYWHRFVLWFEIQLAEARPKRVDGPSLVYQCEYCGKFYSERTEARHMICQREADAGRAGF